MTTATVDEALSYFTDGVLPPLTLLPSAASPLHESAVLTDEQIRDMKRSSGMSDSPKKTAKRTAYEKYTAERAKEAKQAEAQQRKIDKEKDNKDKQRAKEDKRAEGQQRKIDKEKDNKDKQRAKEAKRAEGQQRKIDKEKDNKDKQERKRLREEGWAEKRNKKEAAKRQKKEVASERKAANEQKDEVAAILVAELEDIAQQIVDAQFTHLDRQLPNVEELWAMGQILLKPLRKPARSARSNDTASSSVDKSDDD